MQAFHVIANPLSGRGRAVPVARQVAANLGDAGAAVRITFSPGVDAADALVRGTAEAGEKCVAVGGDGFLSSLAQPLVRHAVPFGVVAAGRGNDFARQLGVPDNTHDAVRKIVGGEVTPVDAIAVADTVVLGSVYAGVDSVVSGLVNAGRAPLPTTVQYQLAAVRGLLRFPPRDFRVTVDGRLYEYSGFTAVVANSGYYGKGMHIAPAADVRDGVLDVVMVGAGSRWRFVQALPRLYRGTHPELPEVVVTSGREVTVEVDGVQAYGDGEPLVAAPVTARVLPGALSVLL